MKITPDITKKPLDVIKFKVQAKDTETFVDYTVERMNNAWVKKNKKATMILENPRYDQYEEGFEKIHFGQWASLNLNRRGFQTSIPVGLDPESAFDCYFFTSEKAQKQVLKKFYGLKASMGLLVDAIKAVSTSTKFSKTVGGAYNDVHYTDAYNFLYEHEVNKHQNNRFQKFLKKFNVKEVQYKAPKLTEDK